MGFQRTLLVAFATMLGTSPAQAHHELGAAFIDDEISIEGTVVEYNFKNPHANIILSVADASGAETLWMATAPAPSSLRRGGWTADSIRVRQSLRITGRGSRDGGPMILLESRHWDGGAIVELDPVEGTGIGVVTGTPNAGVPFTPVASMERSLADGQPNFTGTLAKHPSVRASEATRDRNTPPHNERGASLQAAFDPVDDPSFTECASHGLVRQASTVQVVRIAQFPDRVVFEYEEGAARRVAWLDGRDPEASGDGQQPVPTGDGQQPVPTGNEQGTAPTGNTSLGHSVARYVGDTLVVETDRLLSNLTGTEGNAVSDRHTVVETYRRVDDGIGPAVEMLMVVNDPDYLASPWEIRWNKYYVSDYEFTELDCRLPFFAN